MPALLTTRSTSPSRLASAASRSTSAARLTSHTTTCALPPAAAIASAVARAPSSRRSDTTTVAPRAARPLAKAASEPTAGPRHDCSRRRIDPHASAPRNCRLRSDTLPRDPRGVPDFGACHHQPSDINSTAAFVHAVARGRRPRRDPDPRLRLRRYVGRVLAGAREHGLPDRRRRRRLARRHGRTGATRRRRGVAALR